MQMFVKKNDRIDVEVFVWQDERGNVEATHDKSTVPEKTENVETTTFTFRRPTYLDSVTIMRQSNLREGGMNLADFQDSVLRTLLVDWNLKDDGDKDVSMRSVQVNNLQPAIARAACSGFLEKVNLF